MRRLPLALLLALPLTTACHGPRAALRDDLSELAQSRQAAPQSLRAMTFNIKSGLFGLEKVADAINEAKPDVVALQEVDVGTDRSHGLDEAKRLGELTGMPYARHFKATRLHGGDYGIALLTRLPVVSVEQRMLPTEGREPRTAVHAVLEFEGREVSVYFTHLTMDWFSPKVRAHQSELITAWMASDPRPKLLMGDMNSTDTSRAVQTFGRRLTDVFAKSGRGEPGTYPLPLMGGTSARIDYVMVDPGFQPVSSRVMHVEASDHFPVVADLSLRAGASPAVASIRPKAPITTPASPTR